MEPSAEALAREFREELGCEVRVGRLLWIAEHFYAHGGKGMHGLGLYYEVDILGRQDLLDTTRVLSGVEDSSIVGEPLQLIFKWFPLSDVGNLRLYPTFLREGLRVLPEVTRHIVQME